MALPPPNITPAITALTSTLGTTYRLTIPHSNRTLIGSFLCIDPQGNLILDRTLEFEGTEGESELVLRKGREVGMVLVPRRWWGVVEREVSLRDEEELEGEGHEKAGEEDNEGGCAQS